MSASYRPIGSKRALFAEGPLWTPGRKAEVVLAIRRGLTTREDAIRDYGLSEEELDGWLGLFERHGQRGLATTRIQEMRA